MHIRNANPDDALTISQGEYEAAGIPGLMNALPGEVPESAFLDKIKSLSNEQRGLYIVVEDNGDVVGHLLLDPMPLSSNSHICTLTIVVYPAWQGRGIGRELLRYAIDWAKNASHVEKIELMVRASNERAIALYRYMGFEEEGCIRKRVKVGQIYHDDIAMSLFV